MLIQRAIFISKVNLVYILACLLRDVKGHFSQTGRLKHASEWIKGLSSPTKRNRNLELLNYVLNKII